MELLEIIFYSIAAWPFVLGLVVGAGLGAGISWFATGAIHTELAAIWLVSLRWFSQLFTLCTRNAHNRLLS